MKQANNTKIINYFSLILIVLEYIFTYLKGNNITINGLLFIWLILFNILFYNLNNKYLKYGAVLVMIAAPIIANRSTSGYITLLVGTLGSFVYYYLDLYKTTNNNFMQGFKIAFIIIISISALSFLGSNFMHNMNIIAPYIMIYLISSISILRIIRFEDYEHDNKALGKINLRYNYITFGVAFLLSIKPVRTLLYNAVLTLFNIITNILIYIVAAIFTSIGYIVYFLVTVLGKCINKKITYRPQKNQLMNIIDQLHSKKIYSPGRAHHFINENLQMIILWAILIALIIFLITKIYKKGSLIQKKHECYDEEKNFIHETGNGRRNFPAKFSEYVKHKNNTDIIRLYYKKFLRLCLQNNVPIKPCDTSYDVNDKVQNNLKADKHILDDFRGIYIKIRYDGQEADKNDLEKFKNTYNDVTKFRR